MSLDSIDIQILGLVTAYFEKFNIRMTSFFQPLFVGNKKLKFCILFFMFIFICWKIRLKVLKNLNPQLTLLFVGDDSYSQNFEGQQKLQ